jgi:hypothetical protein
MNFFLILSLTYHYSKNYFNRFLLKGIYFSFIFYFKYFYQDSIMPLIILFIGLYFSEAYLYYLINYSFIIFPIINFNSFNFIIRIKIIDFFIMFR